MTRTLSLFPDRNTVFRSQNHQIKNELEFSKTDSRLKNEIINKFYKKELLGEPKVDNSILKAIVNELESNSRPKEEAWLHLQSISL